MMNFPLYRADGVASVRLNALQRESVAEFGAKLSTGKYHLEDNPCLCGGHDDICVMEKDRYGIPCRYVLCRRCGLVRQEKRLDEESTAMFYRDDYRNIYVGSEVASERFFDEQVEHGERFCRLLAKHVDFGRVRTVFEAGCGAGGILYAFQRRGGGAIKVSGCDFGEKYLAYGQEKGLDLYDGEPDLGRTPPDSQDVVILSHVLEHLNDPAGYMSRLAEITSPEGYIVVELPGLFCMHEQYSRPIGYFQNAHVNNFYAYYLRKFFEALGLKVIYGDEVCTFIVQKPETWQKRETQGLRIWDETMPEWSRKVEWTLKRNYVYGCLGMWYFLHPLQSSRRVIVRILEILGLKELVRKKLGI